MAASDIITIQVLERGVVQEITVYYPSQNLLWSESDTNANTLLLKIRDRDQIEISFPNPTYLSTFKDALDQAITNGTSATLNNFGPLLMLTTTTSTTTTTTHA